MMTQLTEADTISIHQLLVTAALREVIGVQHIRGHTVEEVVADYYEGLSQRAQLLAAHDDPLGLAFDLAGNEAPAPSEDDERYREAYIEVRNRLVQDEIVRRYLKLDPFQPTL